MLWKRQRGKKRTAMLEESRKGQGKMEESITDYCLWWLGLLLGSELSHTQKLSGGCFLSEQISAEISFMILWGEEWTFVEWVCGSLCPGQLGRFHNSSVTNISDSPHPTSPPLLFMKERKFWKNFHLICQVFFQFCKGWVYFNRNSGVFHLRLFTWMSCLTKYIKV